MRRCRTVLFFVLALAGSAMPVRGQEPVTSPPPQNIVLISCDGLDRNILKAMLAERLLPHFASLIAEGSLRDIRVTGHETETMPGHATMLTGLKPDRTGIHDNTAEMPIPAGYTIFERLERHFGPTNIYTLAVAAKSRNLGTNAPYAPYALTLPNVDVFESDDQYATQVVHHALAYLAPVRDLRFFAFLHFRDPDSAGHRYNYDSPRYTNAVITCDTCLGEVRSWLREHNLASRTRIYVVADHGFNEDGHLWAPNVFLATDDKAVIRNGRLIDVPATILARFGLDPSQLIPALDGAPLMQPPPRQR